MKRIGNIYDEIISVENLLLAHKNACKGKSKQKGVIAFKNNLLLNIYSLHEELNSGAYKSPEYRVFIIKEPKEREIFVLPYKHRVIQHAILQKIGEMFKRSFTRDTYSCIKGRGIHSGQRRIKEYAGTNEYVLKLDITKFYPSVDHDILKSLLLRKIKDQRLLTLLFEIIDGAPGLPIGNYLSQPLGNFYLTYFDHWLKEELKIKSVVRYCDDVAIFSSSKPYLHSILSQIKLYLRINLKLEVKDNYQIFPLAIRGLDMLGYVTYPDCVFIRKSIKQRFARMLRFNPNDQSIASYRGWLKWCNGIHLQNKLLNNLKIAS